MATVALGIIGNVIAPGIGGIIGAAVGGIIDNQFIIPALTPDQNFEGPRLQTIQFTGASEGSPINRCFGPRMRVAGTVIWLSDLIETKTTQSSGGKGGGGGGQTQTIYSYSANMAIGVCLGEIEEIDRIWADSKVVYASDQPGDARYSSVRFYTGTQTQNADPLIQAAEGAADTPAYRGLAYVVIEGLQLRDFGNRIPNFRFEVRQKTRTTLAETLVRLLEDAGLTSDQYDVSRVPDDVLGYNIDGSQRISSTIEPLMRAYNLYVQEFDGKLNFFQLGDEDVITVAEDDLDAHQFGTGVGKHTPIEWNDQAGFKIPDEVTVRYIDHDTNYEQGAQTERKIQSPARVQSVLDVPIVLRPTQARELAASRLWRGQTERQTMRFRLPPSYLPMQEGDVALVTQGGRVYDAKITSVTRGDNLVHEYEANIRESNVLGLTRDADSKVTTPEQPRIPIALFLEWRDLPPLRDADAVSPGYYYAMSPAVAGEVWQSGSLWTSSDDVNFLFVENAPSDATIGVVGLATPSGPTTHFDRETEIIVDMTNGELESVSEDLLITGASNLALLGSEIIAFETAELVAPGQYRLKKLLRGLRNTEAEVGNHVASEIFVLLRPSEVGRIDSSLANIGSLRYYRAVSTYDDVISATSVQGTITGESIRPFSPAYLTAEIDGSGDTLIEWEHRTRLLTAAFTGTAAPILESSERYEIDILTPGDVLLRTINSTTRNATYSAADRVTDGIGPTDPIKIRAYQMSDAVGRGRVSEFNLS